MDTLGIEPRASRMLSGCDTTTPRALEGGGAQIKDIEWDSSPPPPERMSEWMNEWMSE